MLLHRIQFTPTFVPSGHLIKIHLGCPSRLSLALRTCASEGLAIVEYPP